VLEVLAQEPPRSKSCQAFLQSLLKGLQYVPHVIVTDKPRSYGIAKRQSVSRCRASAKPTSEKPPREVYSRDTVRAAAPRSLRESSLTAKEASPFRKNGPISRLCADILERLCDAKTIVEIGDDYRRCEDRAVAEQADDRLKGRLVPDEENELLRQVFRRFRPDAGSGAAAHDHWQILLITSSRSPAAVPTSARCDAAMPLCS
jgi:hypothetical protein